MARLYAQIGERRIDVLLDDEAGGVPANRWMLYFAVDDADRAARRIADAGGAVLRQPVDSPFGRVVEAADPFGAVFSVVDRSSASSRIP